MIQEKAHMRCMNMQGCMYCASCRRISNIALFIATTRILSAMVEFKTYPGEQGDNEAHKQVRYVKCLDQYRFADGWLLS